MRNYPPLTAPAHPRPGAAARAAILLTVGALALGVPRTATTQAWHSVGPWRGDVRSVAFAPSNPARVYAGTGSGVYRSEDGGRSWASTGLHGNTIHVVAVNPADSNTVLAGSDGAFFRSEDGGGTWTPLGPLSPDGGAVSFVAFSPADPFIAHAADECGRGRSTDGGRTWRTVNSWPDCPNSIAMFLHPTMPQTLFRVEGTGYGRLCRSDDCGDSWRSCYAGARFSHIAFDPTNPDVLYGSAETGVLKSSDGGASWAPLGTGLATQPGPLTVVPTSPLTLFVVGLDGSVYRSVDAGGQWTLLPDLLVRGLVADPANVHRVLAFGSADHLAHSDDDGSTWAPITAGMANVQALSALATDTRWLVGFNWGVYSSTDRGVAWSLDNAGLPAIAVNQLMAHPWKDGTVLASTPLGLYESGNSLPWSALPWAEKPGRLTLGPESPPTGYGWSPGACGGVWTTGNGTDWVSLPPPPTDLPYWGCSTGLTWSVAADMTVPGRVYSSVQDSRHVGVHWTDDGGSTWHPCASLEAKDLRTTEAPAALWAEDIWGRLYRSLDHCASWQKIPPSSLGAPPNLGSLLVHPTVPDVLFLGTTQGVVVSKDGGASWIPLGSDPRLVNVSDLEMSWDRTTLIAATEGQGILTFDLEPATVTSVSWSPQLLLPGQAATLTTKVTRLFAGPASGGTVLFLLDSVPVAGCTAVPIDATGAATCQTAIPHAGSYTLHVEFS
ncbi:MAG: hypothetical protein MUF10_19120, partial [Thermoanaerobaculaceae bacterium]|nr:hypothetical protein [Thermoanaerobaculaceae bacterium]